MSQQKLLQSIYLDVAFTRSLCIHEIRTEFQLPPDFASLAQVYPPLQKLYVYYFTPVISSNGCSLLTSHPNASTRTTIDFKDVQASVVCNIYLHFPINRSNLVGFSTDAPRELSCCVILASRWKCQRIDFALLFQTG